MLYRILRKVGELCISFDVTLFLLPKCVYIDVIMSLKSDGTAISDKDGWNLETSFSPNDLSNFTSASDSLDKSEDIFTRVQLLQYGPNGKLLDCLLRK